MEACTIDLFSGSKDLSESAQSRLAGYLEGFHAPTHKENKDGKTATITCPKCGSHLLGGGIMDALLSTFIWGIAHGEGFCSECDWPIRMYHFVKLDGDDKHRFEFPLAHRCYTDESHETEVDPAQDRHAQK